MAPRTMARLGVARLNAFRLGYAHPWIKVYVDGVEQTDDAEINGCTITHLLNHEPDTCRLRVHGFTPSQGEEVKVYCGDEDLTHQLFGGHILNVHAGHHAKADGTREPYFDLDCIDYTWLLNRRKVIKKYTSQSATAIIQDLISTYTSGFTSTGVTSGLATIDEITFTNEDVTDAISRVMDRVGGYWYVDYAKDVKAWTSATNTAGSITDATPRGSRDLRKSIDLSQIATRIIGRGGGSVTSNDAVVGQTHLPVDDASWYSASGGTVECGPQRIVYTGVEAGNDGSTTGYIPPPPSVGTLTINNAGGGSLTTASTYIVGKSWVTAEGETTVATTTIATTGATPSIVVQSMVGPTEPKITDLRIYISSANGDASTLRQYGGAGSDFDEDEDQVEILSYNAAWPSAPSSNTAGMATEQTAAGATSMQVEELSSFPASGWAYAPGDQIFYYSGRSQSSGSGTLTGIPASGLGAITAPVRAGTIKVAPHLTGIAASGAGSILYDVQRGEPVNVISIQDDTTAQTALAALVGGDGIHETFITDGRLSQDELDARCEAELTLRKDPLTTVTFESHDQMQNVGWSLTLNVTDPTISNTLTIQSVTFTLLGAGGVNGMVFPRRAVTASSRRWSFEDLLRQIKGEKAA